MMNAVRRFVSSSCTYSVRYGLRACSNSTAELKNEAKSEGAVKDQAQMKDKDSDQSTKKSEPTTVDNELQEKENLLQQKDEEISQFKEKYLRALAEAENTRKIMSRQIDESRKYGIQNFAKDLVEVADILEKAMESVPESELKPKVNPQLLSLFEGLQMTKNELMKVFVKNGLERIEKVGEDFNPSIHEALFELPGDKPGTVGVVSKVGYLLNGRTVRPAMVGVIVKK